MNSPVLLKKRPVRACSTCIHCDVCGMRIEARRAIQHFKYLAETSTEVKNTGCTHSTGDVFAAIAGACVKWVRDEG